MLDSDAQGSAKPGGQKPKRTIDGWITAIGTMVLVTMAVSDQLKKHHVTLAGFQMLRLVPPRPVWLLLVFLTAVCWVKVRRFRYHI